MPDAPTGRNRSRRPLSSAAQAEIARRRTAARPHYALELAAVVKSRDGQLTDEQLSIIADLLSHVVAHPDALPSLVRDWLADASADTARAPAFFTSPRGRDCLDRARAAHCEDRLSDPRRNPTADDLRQAFGITADETAALGLERLVDEATRSRLRRRAEGARPAEEVAAERAAAAATGADQPWVTAGVSRATWFRRQRSEPVRAAAAAVQAAAGGADVPEQPWIAAGMSRATWYRRQRETAGETQGDPIGVAGSAVGKEPEFGSSISFYRNRVASSLTDSLTGASDRHAARLAALVPATIADVPVGARRTAEARRLAVLAVRLRLAAALDSEQPHDWYVPLRPLTPAEEAEFSAAVADATAAERRVRAEAIAKALREEREAGAQPAPTHTTREYDPQSCPVRVSPRVWERVPSHLRPRVRRLAGRRFAQGLDPDAAVADVVEQARREYAVVSRVQAAAPGDAGSEHVERLAERYWTLPTAEAVVAVLAALRDERRLAVVLQAVPEADRCRVKSAVENVPLPLRANIASEVIAALLEQPEYARAHGGMQMLARAAMLRHRE